MTCALCLCARTCVPPGTPLDPTISTGDERWENPELRRNSEFCLRQVVPYPLEEKHVGTMVRTQRSPRSVASRRWNHAHSQF